MRHRIIKSELGPHCFRCGTLTHSIAGDECNASRFSSTNEDDLTSAENWVAAPHNEERNVLAVRAYLAGLSAGREENK